MPLQSVSAVEQMRGPLQSAMGRHAMTVVGPGAIVSGQHTLPPGQTDEPLQHAVRPAQGFLSAAGTHWLLPIE